MTFVAIIVALSVFGWMEGRYNRTRGRYTVKENPASVSEGTVANDYGGSASCRACHLEEYQLWAGSHHGLAQRAPDARLDEDAFDPQRSFQLGKDTFLVRKRAAQYEFITAGLSGTQECFGVDGVIGEAPLRQFLVGFPGGRLQTVEASYDPAAKEWFNVFGQEDRQVGEWGHWTGRGMNWNSMCASCHNTRVRKNYQEEQDTYHTTMVEQSVGCESCHGPLGAHNRWQRQFGKSNTPDPTLPHWAKERVVDNCGFCHARRADLTGDFKPGDNFLDQMRPVIVDASDIFYPDGQVREEDYEYAPFLGSRMSLRGIHCMDCHNPHSAKTLLPGNWLCMRCHNGSYTNAPVVEPLTHSHHKVFGYASDGRVVNNDLSAYQVNSLKETGGECVNCHMPQTTYMQRHRRHDHGFSIPDPLLTKTAGIPNACNRCHQDKDAGWALKYCDEWYGPRMNRPYRRHALVVADARKNEPGAKAGLLDMLSDDDLPYWRAVAAGLLESWAGDPLVRQRLIRSLADTNALVRLECVRALEPFVSVAGVAEALHDRMADPIRGVRVGAAWASRGKLDMSSTIGAELSRFLAVNADQPAGQLQQGALAVARGDPALAARHYQKAIRWDPGSAVSRHDYAVVLSSLNRSQEAVEQLEAACKLEPSNADFQYKLALGCNELGQTDRAIALLQAAVRLDPGHAKAWYNLGLALNSTGRTEEALQALIRAESADGSDPRGPYARATILARLGALDDARKAASKAIAIDPGFEPARELLRSLR